MWTLLHAPRPRDRRSVETPWPTANSPTSRYCRSADRARPIQRFRVRGDRALVPTAASQDTSTLSPGRRNAVSRASSGACGLRFTRKTDTDWVPTGNSAFTCCPRSDRLGRTRQSARPPETPGVASAALGSPTQKSRRVFVVGVDARKRKRSYRYHPPPRWLGLRVSEVPRSLGEGWCFRKDSHPT